MYFQAGVTYLPGHSWGAGGSWTDPIPLSCGQTPAKTLRSPRTTYVVGNNKLNFFRPIGQEFTVRFAEIFNVQIVQWPENIKLQV